MRTVVAALLLVPGAAFAQIGEPVSTVLGGPEARQFDWPEISPPTVFFYNIYDGATISNPVSVEIGMVGVTAAPNADPELVGGPIFDGRYFLLVNPPTDGSALETAIPLNSTHAEMRADGRAATLDLPLGRHVLQLAAVDESGETPSAILSDALSVTIVEESAAEIAPPGM